MDTLSKMLAVGAALLLLAVLTFGAVKVLENVAQTIEAGISSIYNNVPN